jgi:hypothetical protein
MRPIVYTLCLAYFAFTGYFDLLVKPACTCQIAEPPRRAVITPDWGNSTRIDSLEGLRKAWNREGLSSQGYAFALNEKPVQGWAVTLPGSQPTERPIVFATDKENHEAMTVMFALSKAFKEQSHLSPILFIALDFKPTSSTEKKKRPFTADSPILFVDDLFANGQKDLSSIYRRYVSSDNEPEVIGDYASRHIVKLAAGFFNRFSERSVPCFRKFPLVPEVTSPHSPWFAGTGLTAAVFYGGLSRGDGSLQTFTRAWYLTLLEFSNT